jgi:hypothetical protein
MAPRCRRSRWPPAGQRLRVGLSNDIDAALERLYEKPEPEETDLDADLGNFSEEDIEHLRDLASEAPIIRLVNQICNAPSSRGHRTCTSSPSPTS